MWTASAVYLFGSLIYKGGVQFGESSDIDLVVIMPELHDALARHRWLDKFSQHKDALEIKLLRTLTRLGNEPLVSVVAVTRAEIEMDIHKDGHREFFSSNTFRDFSTSVQTVGLPCMNPQKPTRFVAGAIGFVQKIRNEYLAVSPNGTATLVPYVGSDPLPKRLMRAAAMAAHASGQSQGPGAEHDVQEGLDLLTNYLYSNRSSNPAFRRLQDLLSVRRLARGAHGPVTASDQLLLAELIYDLTLGGTSSGAITPGKSNWGATSVDERGNQTTPAVISGEAGLVGQGDATALLNMPHSSSTAFFADRFAKAFPGVRDTTWFVKPHDVAMRLGELLKPPLAFSDGTPIWWWRGGNLQIERFERLDSGEFLMNYEELRIARIAAVPSASYHRNFVYIDVSAMPSTGLYEQKPNDVERRVSEQGYDAEEYGLYRGRHLLTRAEYDDGATTIDGVLVSTSGASELRVRYITPYNFVIAAANSPINNMDFDHTLEEKLNEALRSGAEGVVEELRGLIRKLPLPTRAQ